jgi:hypothetical protein
MDDGKGDIPFDEEVIIPKAGSDSITVNDRVTKEGYAAAKTRFGDKVTDITLIRTMTDGSRH